MHPTNTSATALRERRAALLPPKQDLQNHTIGCKGSVCSCRHSNWISRLLLDDVVCTIARTPRWNYICLINYIAFRTVFYTGHGALGPNVLMGIIYLLLWYPKGGLQQYELPFAQTWGRKGMPMGELTEAFSLPKGLSFHSLMFMLPRWAKERNRRQGKREKGCLLLSTAPFLPTEKQ